MTLRELVERIERESLHPTTWDLPLTIVQRKKRGGVEEERKAYVSDIRIDSVVGLEICVTIDSRGPV